MNFQGSSTPGDTHLLLSSRWVYRTLREVYLENHSVVLKRFVHHPGRRDFRRVWAREDRALRRLIGLPVPATFGFQRRQANGIVEYLLRKSFIPGEPLTQLDAETAGAMGALLGRIHARRVVTCDPSRANFIRAPDGVLHFIDFGRARTFFWQTPLFLFYAGKDLARCYRTGVGSDPVLWAPLEAAYFIALNPSPAAARFIRLCCRFWIGRQRKTAAPRPAANAPAPPR